MLHRILLVAALFLPAVLLVGACDGTEQPGVQVQTEDVRVGTGRAAATRDRLRVSYEGRVAGKTTFDAGSFTFVLGNGEILAGLDQGIVGMKVGGQRRITIPPALGYGAETLRAASGATLVPSGSTLVYVVELLDNSGPAGG
ncbi:MAG: FKBP-type peptidyl-prolyl cis-trans isomerase [Bacteroidetes bacterium]|nr:FKBP-type peptidyl-prolyl cis-trans isomerase [Bacteroidota bacterium]